MAGSAEACQAQNVTVGPNAPLTATGQAWASVDVEADFFDGTLTVNSPVTVTAGSFAEATFEGNAVNINGGVFVANIAVA